MLVNFLAYVNYLVIRQQCKSIWNFEVQYFKIAVPAICEPQIVYICFQFETNIVVGVIVGVQWVVWLAINKSLIIYLRGVAKKVRVLTIMPTDQWEIVGIPVENEQHFLIKLRQPIRMILIILTSFPKSPI